MFFCSAQKSLSRVPLTSLTLHCTMWNPFILVFFFLNFFFKYFQYVYPNFLRKVWRILWCLINMQNFTIQKRNTETCHQNDSSLENITVNQGCLFQLKQHQGIHKEQLTCCIPQINCYRPTQPLSHSPHRCTPKLRSQNLI